MSTAVYLNLDDAWPPGVLEIPTRDLREWGPRLRYIARRRDIESFHQILSADAPRFILYGSGDFHHLAGMLIRRVKSRPFTLISFDNHPDWDVKPPYWSCGGWAARTLYTGQVEHVSVWGCGNFELSWPARWSADWKMLNAGKLTINAWAERQSPATSRRFNCMTRENWRDRFITFCEGLAGLDVYVTVDFDCLRQEEAITNWENGLFTTEEVAWAIRQLRQSAHFIGADVCGAYSPPVYQRWGQRFAGNWDHPKLPPVDVARARELNVAALGVIWPAIVH